MDNHDWMIKFPGSITVSDADGIIIDMNEKAADSFIGDGGFNLKGKNLFECHPEPSRSQLKGMFKNQELNVYTIEKKGIKKLIYQTPWYQEGKFAGFIELSLEIPWDMPHFIRD